MVRPVKRIVLVSSTGWTSQAGYLTIAVKGSPLILKLEMVEVSRLHEAREHVLLRQLLPGLEGVNWPNLERERGGKKRDMKHTPCTQIITGALTQDEGWKVIGVNMQ